MRDSLVTAAGDPAAVDAALATLATNAAMLERLSYEILRCAWDEPDQAERIRNAGEHAKAALPVIDTAILAMVLLYGMYLLPGGNKESEVIEKDGTRRTKWYPHPLSDLVDLIRGRKSTEGESATGV